MLYIVKKIVVLCRYKFSTKQSLTLISEMDIGVDLSDDEFENDVAKGDFVVTLKMKVVMVMV